MIKTNVTKQHPCPICGKGDWCMVMQGSDGPLHYCARVHEDTVVTDHTYIRVKTTDSFSVYEEEEQRKAAKSAWMIKNGLIAEQKASIRPKNVSNPNYRNRNTYKTDIVATQTNPVILDRVYRSFLNALILEPKDREILEAEWGKDLCDKILARYPIKSVPMVDRDRFNYGVFFESPWRKALVEKMGASLPSIEDLDGVPYFYQLDSGARTFHSLSGIVFPVFNTKGQIIRLRIKDRFPTCEGNFEGETGTFLFSSYKGGWIFRKDGSSYKDDILVYQPKTKTYKIRLNKAGVPISTDGVTAKVKGKYKNCSSYAELVDDENKIITNKLKNGAQSGSYPSIYFSPSDSFHTVYFTEGEKKSMVCNELLHAPCVSFPGVGCFSKAFTPQADDISIVEYCLKRGMERAVLCYDADKNGNMAVLKQETNCIQWFLQHKIEISIGSWIEEMGKGLDDILIQGIRPTIHEIK